MSELSKSGDFLEVAKIVGGIFGYILLLTGVVLVLGGKVG